MAEKKTEREEAAELFGDRADNVRRLSKGGETVWVDKGSDTEAKYLDEGWKGEGAGSKKPSEAPEPPQSGDPAAAFAAELSTTSPSLGTEPTSEPGLPSPPVPLEGKAPTTPAAGKAGPKAGKK